MEKSKLLDRCGAEGEDRLLLAKVLDRAEQAVSRSVPAHTDFLSPQQQAQARELGEKLRTSGLRIDEILYSPLSRAADTARAIAEATGIPARCEPRLREQCFGRYEGTPRDGEEFRISKTHFADRYSGGESMMQLAQRIYNLLDELRADTDKTFLLVAHNGIARVVQSYFYDMTNEEYAAAGIKNCEFVEFTF